MSDEEVAAFVAGLTESDSGNLASVLRYPHPFSAGGLVVVFDDRAGSYSKLHAAITRAVPPQCALSVVKRTHLFVLALPRIDFAFPPFEYPHMVFFLKHRGEILYGEDVRGEIPPLSGAKYALEHILDIMACWFRDHGILRDLQQRAYQSLIDNIDMRLRFLMSVALLVRCGEWDVEAETVAPRFFTEIRDDELKEIWRDFEGLGQEVGVQEEEGSRSAAFRAAWLFEAFSRGLRRHTP